MPYLGRIVAAGLNRAGRPCAMYRVSSRSFPNREAVIHDGLISIVPRAGFEGDLRKNPYIAYNCLRRAGDFMVATNGSQTDPIAEKIAMNMPVRDAVTLGLLAMDYEKDSLDTPRIVAVIGKNAPVCTLGIVRKNAVLVREFELKAGVLFYLSTYECNQPCDNQTDTAFDAPDAPSACGYVLSGGVFSAFTNPVTAACAVFDGQDFQLAAQDA